MPLYMPSFVRPHISVLVVWCKKLFFSKHSLNGRFFVLTTGTIFFVHNTAGEIYKHKVLCF